VGGFGGLIIILEGCEWWGWKSFAIELRKVLAFFDVSQGTGSSVLFPRQPIDGT
jgi:hypothetical protein